MVEGGGSGDAMRVLIIPSGPVVAVRPLYWYHDAVMRIGSESSEVAGPC